MSSSVLSNCFNSKMKRNREIQVSHDDQKYIEKNADPTVQKHVAEGLN